MERRLQLCPPFRFSETHVQFSLFFSPFTPVKVAPSHSPCRQLANIPPSDSMARQHHPLPRHPPGYRRHLLPLHITPTPQNLLPLLGLFPPKRRGASHRYQQGEHGAPTRTHRMDGRHAVDDGSFGRVGTLGVGRHAVSISVFLSSSEYAGNGGACCDVYGYNLIATQQSCTFPHS